ncbi:MAG: CpaF family protein [Peptococcaceae bacterium]|nr:CpaF family protein [Peptococcaceae bacterium]MDH7525091.1 CpaF family protein [Peptococcaceae bacterium]
MRWLEKKERLIGEIRDEVSRRVDFSEEPSDEEVEELITRVVFEKTREYYLDLSERQEVIRQVFNAMRRLGELQPLMEDNSITEIMVNGPEHVFIERGGSVYETNITIESREKLEDMIQSIVSRVNRAVNEASPLVDARLKDGSRVSVILPPVALDGPVMNIRKFPERPLTVDELVAGGTLTGEAAEFLGRLVKARYNIFICGGTGSGKTTFLNTLANFIPLSERIVTIEDSAELQLKALKNVVRMEARNANTEGRGQVTLRDLIKMSLRLRPDRIIVGEVRGPEALDMLQAMNTGHEGSLSTGHANTPGDMLRRLETMVLMGTPLPLEAVRQQIASALDIVVHLSRLRDSSRRVLEITEVAGCEKGEIVLNPLFVFRQTAAAGDGIVNGSLQRTGNPLLNRHKLKMAGLPGES